MSAKSKNCPPAQKKPTREKPATPPPSPVPVFAKVPCPRDQQAYGLHLEQHSQRWIADKLKCTQPTVLRGIRRMEKWLATTLPEDRGEYTATEKLRLALAKHERLMERLLKMSLREFRRSRKTIPMKKTISMKDGVDEQGEPVKIRIEEWNKPQIGRKGFIDAAAKISHETTVLAAGWLGPGSGSISCAEVMDPEERDRWDRMVTTRDAQIKKLEENGSAEAETPVVLGAGLPTPPTGLTAGLPAGGEAGDLRSGVTAGSETRAEQREPAQRRATARPTPVSQVNEKEPAVNQETDHQVVATSDEPTACVTPSEDIPPPTADSQTCITGRPGMDMEPDKVNGEQRNARVLDVSSGVTSPQGNANPACISQSLMHPTPTTLDESRRTESTPSVNQNPPAPEVATSIQQAPFGEASDASQAVFEKVNQGSQEAVAGPPTPRSQALPGNGISRGSASPEPTSSKEEAVVSEDAARRSLEDVRSQAEPGNEKFRWEDSFRQEALDYHCLKFGLPPATTDMATGIPDPIKMSPRLWMERGYPYQIFIDRDIPCNRRNPLDTMGVIKLACHPVVKGDW